MPLQLKRTAGCRHHNGAKGKILRKLGNETFGGVDHVRIDSRCSVPIPVRGKLTEIL